MILTSSILDNLFEKIIIAGDIEEFQNTIDFLESLIIETNSFSDEIFRAILNLISKKYFLELEESRYILYVFINNFDALSEIQKNELFVILENYYSKLKDWMSWLIVSEIFGKCFQNKQALYTLCKFKKIEDEHSRSFIAHGLEHLAQSQNHELMKLALDELLSFKNDPSQRVQYEVDVSLKRLKNKGYSF